MNNSLNSDNKQPKMSRRLPAIFAFILIVGAGLWGYGKISGRVGTEIPAPDPTEQADTQKENEAKLRPTKVVVSSIGVEAPVIDLRLNIDRTLQVPATDHEVGWYVGSSQPGEPGPAVLVGHLDSGTGPAVFWRLQELEAGDRVEVVLEDGSIQAYKIERKEVYSQDDFPTMEVYGPTEQPTIRLITCEGNYDRLRGRYSDNLVVFGSLVQ